MASRLHLRWVNASRTLERVAGPLGAHLLLRVQLAGRLDERLRPRDAWYGEIEERQRDAEVDLTFDEYLHLSLLWVLDVFELVRTMETLVRRGRLEVTPAANVALRRIKADLARVRTPLAKFEASGRPEIALAAYPVLVASVGAGWDVGEASPYIVSRQSLSEQFLSFLEAAAIE
jgi:hypothetical protein